MNLLVKYRKFFYYDTPSISDLSTEIDELLEKGLSKFMDKKSAGKKLKKCKKTVKNKISKKNKIEKTLSESNDLSLSMLSSSLIEKDRSKSSTGEDFNPLQLQWREISATIIEWIIYSVTDMIIPLHLMKIGQTRTRRSSSGINKDSDNMKRNVSFNKIIKVAESKSCNSEISDDLNYDYKQNKNDPEDDIPSSSQIALRSRDSLELLRTTSSYLAVHPNEASNALNIVSNGILVGLLKPDQIHRLFSCIAEVCPKLDKLAFDELIYDETNNNAMKDLASSILHSTLARNVKIIQKQEKDKSNLVTSEENQETRPEEHVEKLESNKKVTDDDIQIAKELRELTKSCCFDHENSMKWKKVAVDFLAHVFRQVYANYLKDKRCTTREDIKEHLIDHAVDMYLESSNSIVSNDIITLIEKFANLQNNWSVRFGCPLHSRKIDNKSIEFIKNSLIKSINVQKEIILNVIDYSLDCSVTQYPTDSDYLIQVSSHNICHCKAQATFSTTFKGNSCNDELSPKRTVKTDFKVERDIYFDSSVDTKISGSRYRKRFSSSAGSIRSRGSADGNNSNNVTKSDKVYNECDVNTNNNNNNDCDSKKKKKFLNIFKKYRSCSRQRSRMNSLSKSVEEDFQAFRKKSITKDSENQIDILSKKELKRFSLQSNERRDSLRSNDFVVVLDTNSEEQQIKPVFQGIEIEGLDKSCNSGLSAVTVKNGLKNHPRLSDDRGCPVERLSYIDLKRPELSLHYSPENFDKDLAMSIIRKTSQKNQENCTARLNTTILKGQEEPKTEGAEEKVLSVINLENEENTNQDTGNTRKSSLRLIRKTIEALYESFNENNNNNNNEIDDSDPDSHDNPVRI